MWRSLAGAILFLGCAVAHAEEDGAPSLAALTSGIAARQAAVTAHKDEGCASGGVEELLASMIELDQFVRGSLHTLCPTRDKACLGQVIPQMQVVDGSNLQRLKSLLAKYSWTDLAQCGFQAQHNAWLLVQHADAEPKFQNVILGQMKTALLVSAANSNDYAYLADRVAVNAHKSQIYGTQGMCQPDGSWKPDPIAAPNELDERRHEMKMQPMTDYIADVSQFCAMPKR